ncbi:L-lactate permease [Nocardiopsis coralliicola]
MEIPLTLLNWSLALLPLALLVFMMALRRWGAAEAGPLAWIAAAAVAATAFRMSPADIGLQSVKGTWDALTILYVVWPAILIYEVTREAGAFEPFRRGIARLLPHPLIQVMAFGWVFASFLQGVTGFGVPIAVCAPLLVGIGVRPLYAVVIPLVGHAWNNTFGTLGVAWLGLKQVTAMEPAQAAATALYASAFIWVLNLLGGLLVCWLYDRFRGVRTGLPAVAAVSLVHGGLTLGLSQWSDVLNGFIAGIAGFALIFALGRLPRYRQAPAGGRIFEPGAARPGAAETGTEMSLAKAFLPYYALLAVTLGVLLAPPVEQTLAQFSFALPFPELTTGFGFATEAAAEEISLLTHSGTFLFAAAFIGYGAYRRMGHIPSGGWRRVWASTAEKAIPSTVAVVALVAMAAVMQGAGQADVLSRGAAAATGGFYAFLAPFIGVLGAFMTSSNLASNLLFGGFQQTTAAAAGLSTSAVLGAQTAGGAVGNIISPGNVLLGTTTAGILGEEGDVLRFSLPLALLITAVIGAAVLAVA